MRISSLSKKTFWWSEVFGRSGKNAPGQTFRLIFLSQYLSCSLISISPFSCTQTIFLSLSLSLPLLHPLSQSHTHTILHSGSYTLYFSLSHTHSILHSVSYTLYLTLCLIHTVFISISYTIYLTLCLIHTLSYSLSHTHCLYLYIIHNLSYTLSHTHSILHSGSYTLSFSLYHTHTILLSLSSPHLQYIARSLSLSLANTLFLSLGLSLTSHSIIHPLLLTIFPSICLSASLASPLSFLNTNYHLWTHSRSHLLLKISILCYLSHYQKLFSSFSVSPSHSTKLTL